MDHSLTRKILEYPENKEFARLALELHSGVRDSLLGLEDLTFLIRTWFAKEIDYMAKGEDDWAYITPDLAYDICISYAFDMICKELQDGRWSIEEGMISDGGFAVSLDELKELFSECIPSDEDPEEYEEDLWDNIQRVNDLLNFASPGRRFTLAPIDHITEENAMVVFSHIIGIRELKAASLEDLRKYQRIDTEKFTIDELKEEIHRYIYQMYCYQFLENADSLEQAECGDALTRMDEAVTLRDAAYASAEVDLWLFEIPVLPYTVYRLITEN